MACRFGVSGGLVQSGVESSVGRAGDSCDNAPRSSRGQALAGSIVGLYKIEVITRYAPLAGARAVELATLEWVHW